MTAPPLPEDVETWQLDGITFGSSEDGCRYVVNEVQGWDSGPAPRSGRTNKAAGHGSYRSPVFNNERPITLEGWVDVPDERTARTVRDRLKALCTDPYVLYELRHTDSLSGEDAVAFVERDDETLVDVVYGVRPLRVDFSAQLVAPDARLFSAEQQTAYVSLVKDAPGGIQWGGAAGSTGLEWAPGLRWQSGNGETGTLTAANAGSADAPMQFVITGPVVNPAVVCTSDGRTIRYGGTVGAGQLLKIDTGTGAVTLDGANRRPFLTRAEFFSIPPHSSISIAFRSDEPSDAALAAAWRSASW